MIHHGLRLLVILVCFGCFPAPTVSAGETGRVQKVLDGDTVLLEDGRKVRYLGINTPEYQEPFYLKAKRFNENLVLANEVRLEFDEEERDGHERLLAYVYVGGELVNAKLIEAGLAHAFFIGPNRKHNELFLSLQTEAKRKRIGLWSVRGGIKDLKITTVRVPRPDEPDPDAPYVRIASLADEPLSLAGYALGNEKGDRYVFPKVTLEPGFTVIVGSGDEGISRGRSGRQPVVSWPQQKSVWDPKEDTAFLFDPSGNLVDKFHYRGKRVTKSSR